MEKYYVTTPIYYPNGVPTIGSAYTTLVADVLARWHKLTGKDVFFLTGTDENAQKVYEAAQNKGEDPKKFVDELAVEFEKAFKQLNLDYDRFIRTTEDDHLAVVKAILTKAHENGDVYKGQYEGLYCVGCEAYFNERDAVEGKCPLHKNPLEVLKKDSYFFKLSEYQDKLLKLYKDNPTFIMPKNRRQEILSRVQEGLKDLSISREDYGWGIHLPFDKTHVCYVWYDALTNYLTGIGFLNDKEKFEKYWPADVHIVGKDILWFHTVIWPAMLMSVGLETPKTILAHGWWTFDAQKISKSGKMITVDELIKIAGIDAGRYFLLRHTSFAEDGDFSEEALIDRYNNELGNELGNLVSRLATLIEKKCDGVIPKETSKELFSEDVIEKLHKNIEVFELHKVLDEIFVLLKKINKHLNDTEPWKLYDQKKIETILYTCVDALRLVTIPLSVFIPSTCENIVSIFSFTNLDFSQFHWNLTESNQITKGEVLFPKIEVPLKNVFPLYLKVGEIVSVSNHPNADKLYILQIDMDKRIQLVGGIKQWYSPQDLVGHKVIVVANLKHATLRGVLSEGMLLAAEDDEGVKLLTCDAAPGTVVTVDGYDNNTAQITYEQFSEVVLRVEEGAVFYDSTPLKAGKPVIVDIADNAKIR